MASSDYFIVPQKSYTCQGSFAPLHAISFEEYGIQGVRLSHALLNELDGLKDADSIPRLTNTAQKVTIRINVSRYIIFSLAPSRFFSSFCIVVARPSSVVGCHACIQSLLRLSTNHKAKIGPISSEESQAMH